MSFLNHLKYRFDYRFAKHLGHKKPIDVSLELSSFCNQACGYCYHADPKNLPFTKNHMSYEIAGKILAEAAALEVPAVKFNWKGESTLNPEFAKITRLAKNLSDSTTFIDRLTNSNFKFPIAREDIFEGLCNQTKVKVSYDSFNPQVMEAQRAGSNHAKATMNIDYFYYHPKRKNTELVIQAVRTNLNKDEDLEYEIKRRWPDATASIRDVVGGRLDRDISNLQHVDRDFSERQSCIQAHARVIFNAQGVAFPCCPDIGEKLKIGDIRATSLKEIFNSVEARQLREDLKSKKAFGSNPCASCPSYETYKGYKPKWNS